MGAERKATDPTGGRTGSLHADGGAAIHLLPSARSRYLGDQIGVVATFQLASRFTLFASGARLTGGGYLRQAGATGAATAALGLRWQL